VGACHSGRIALPRRLCRGGRRARAALESVALEVDITGLPASEQAALVPLLRAARQMDALYMRQVWPGTRALIPERQSSQTSASQVQLDAVNFFKGPGGPEAAGNLREAATLTHEATLKKYLTLHAQALLDGDYSDRLSLMAH
jgi:hypothetical protein